MKLNSEKQTDVRGVGFDTVTLEEAAQLAENHIRYGDTAAAVYTPNSEIVQLCIEDGSGELYNIINSAELIVPDGIGVVKAARILRRPLKGKVAGIELGSRMLEYAAADGIPVYFLGGKPGVAEVAAEKMCEKYAGLRICGTHDGYFNKKGEQSDAVIDKINESGAVILYVCLGAPAQELWIYENKSKFSPHLRLMLGLGGSLDVYAGNVKRAPRIFIKLGLEWLYRLLCEPSRIIRMTALPRFYFGARREARQARRGK